MTYLGYVSPKCATLSRQVQGVRPDSEQGAVTPTQLQHHFAPDQVTQPAQPRTTKTALDAAQESFDRVCTLWTMVERLDEDYQQWVHEDFLAQDVQGQRFF